MNLTEDYSRYMRIRAELFARAKGYDARKLRKALQRDGAVLYPIDGEGAAVAIDKEGKASLVSFLIQRNYLCKIDFVQIEANE